MPIGLPNPALLTSVLAAVAASGAAADDATILRTIVDRSLSRQTVAVRAFDPESIVYLDERGLPRIRSLASLTAVLPGEGGLGDVLLRPGEQLASDPTLGIAAVVALTDGQRLRARVAAPSLASDVEEAVVLTIAGQTVPVPLERVASIEIAPHDAGDLPGDADAVVLTNGDVLIGFVESVGPIVTVDADGLAREIPLERVAEIGLANPTVEPETTLAYLADGTIVAIRALEPSGAETLLLTLALTAQDQTMIGDGLAQPAQISTRVDELLGLWLYRPEDTIGILPLAEIRPRSFQAAPERRWSDAPAPISTTAPVAGAQDIELPGPMTVTWPIPRGATRFATTITLGLNPGPWADCEVSVYGNAIDGTATRLAAHRLRAADPTLPINLSLSPDTRAITVAVDPGAAGPIQDRVVLERPMLLIAR